MKKQAGNLILKLTKYQPHIKGLILIGGNSSRMGTDKSQLNYHGKPQKEIAKKLLEDQGLTTFFSVAESKGTTNEIEDTVPNLGPFGGVYSAFQQDANSAWFVLATDVPFVNKELVRFLLNKRNSEKLATVVQGKSKEYPEPLIAIYEPQIYPILKACLKEGNRSLKKILMSLDIEIVGVDDTLIRNVNTPTEFEQVKKEFTQNVN